MHLIHPDPVATPAVFPPDRHYWLGTRGFLHASYRMVSLRTARQQAVILLSACGRPFRLRAEGLDVLTQAAVVGPQVLRSLDAVGVELLAFHIAPDHPAFASLCRLCGGGVKLLQPASFRPWNAALRDTVWGTPHVATTRQLFEQVVQAVRTDHGLHFVPDPRLAEVLASLGEQLNQPLDRLARLAGLSSGRLSRLFIDELGLPLRSYQTWRRTAIAWELFAFRQDLSLTDAAYEAGYSDSAHMSRTWQRLYGVSPSYMRDQVRSFR